MNVKHCDCLSWFSRKHESHKQDGEALSVQHGCTVLTATGDPAMAFGPCLDMNGQRLVPRIGSLAAGCSWQLRCRAKAGAACAPPTTRGASRAQTFLTANTQPFDQLLVTPIVRAPQIIENLAPLRHELKQAAPRMVVFHMTLEVIRQVVDPL
jgi:hypothetical protein